MGGGMSGGGGGGGRGPYFKGTKRANSGRNTTIHKGRQGKHIFNHNNNTDGRSLFTGTYEDAQELVDRFTGTGTRINADKERVDFGRVIGKYYSQKTGEYYDTTVGIIHYSKNGTHIVPQRPNDWAGD